MTKNNSASEMPLTEQELQILKLIARGGSTNSIAEEMGLKPNTIMWYRKRLHVKFKVHSVAELIHKAGELHIIEY